MLPLLYSLSEPSLNEIQVTFYKLWLQVCLQQRWPLGRHFEWYQKSDFLRAKFQTNWPIHFWEIAVHGRTGVHVKL